MYNEYDEMVKNAYEEICGFEKEAKISNLSDEKLQRKIDDLKKSTKGGYGRAAAKGAAKGFAVDSLLRAGCYGLNKKYLGNSAPINVKNLLSSMGENAATWAGASAVVHKLDKNKLKKLQAEQERRSGLKEAACYDEEFNKQAYSVDGSKIILNASEYATRYGVGDKIKNAVRSNKVARRVGHSVGQFIDKHPTAAGATLAATAAVTPGAVRIGKSIHKSNKFNKKHLELWERVRQGDPEAGKKYNRLWAEEHKKTASQF